MERVTDRILVILSYVTFDFFEIYGNFPRKVTGDGPRLCRRPDRRLAQTPGKTVKLRKLPTKKIDQNFDTCSVSILDRFWLPLDPQVGLILGHFGVQDRSWIVLKSVSHRKRRFLRNSTKTNRKSMKMPPGDTPKTTPNRPKLLPRGS